MCEVTLCRSLDTWLTFSPGNTWIFPLFSLSPPPPPLSLRNDGPNKKQCLIQLTLLKMHSHFCWAHVKMVLFICLHMYKSSTVQVFMKYSTGRFNKKCSDHLNKVWHKAEVMDTLNVHLYAFVCVCVCVHASPSYIHTYVSSHTHTHTRTIRMSDTVTRGLFYSFNVVTLKYGSNKISM
jgi:hypothetical protein